MEGLRRYLVLAFILLPFKFGFALEPELVLEMPVEGRIIGGDILDGKVVSLSREKLWVSTPEGKRSFQMSLKPNQGVVASDDGGFFGITTYSKDVPVGFLGAERFELHSADGEKLWEIEDPEVSEFYVSNGAKLTVGISANGESPESHLAFYNQAGELIFGTKVGFLQGVSFSANGKYFFASSAKDGLKSFDESGQLKDNFGTCDKFAVSPDGDYVATVLDGNLKFFHQGKPIGDPREIDPLVRAMSFSPESECLAVLDKKNLYLFEVAGGKLLWQHTLDQTELSFISVDVSPGAERIIAGIDFDKGREAQSKDRHTRGLVYIFDREGKITWQREFSYQLWSALFPRVQFSSDATRFSVMTREKVYVFATSQPEE
ncbi:MAG: WD40 repeat domain-containing protein [Candidatus Zixiibacteriota bacterium]